MWSSFANGVDVRGSPRCDMASTNADGKPEPLKRSAIAAASKGRYVPLATAGTAETTLGAIYRKFLRQVAVKEQNEESERTAEQYHVFLLPGLAFLLAGAMLSKGRFGRPRIGSRAHEA